MSSHYNTEPPPTASATLHTTAGDIHISLFAKQTPLTCKNFIQHCLDGYYVGTTFHRIVPGFVVQAGDPTGTGSGGASIYEDPEFEYDYSREPAGEKVVFKDEIHSRLRFNRRGLVGMAKSEDGTYGSQFFVTLGPADREMTGKYTMFGRLEGDSIYTVVKIAEGELIEGTERPAFPVKITGCEVEQLGPFEGVLHKREKVAQTTEGDAAKKKKKKKPKQKGGRALLSFADEEEEEGDAEKAMPVKPKFNTRLVADTEMPAPPQRENEKRNEQKRDRRTSTSTLPTRPSEDASRTSRKRSLPPERSRTPPILRKPPRDPNTQIPLPDPENPSRSPSLSPPPPTKKSSLSKTNAEIESLKASMRRNTSSVLAEPPRKKTALEPLIPETSIRGRKRPPPGSTPAAASNGFKNGTSEEEEAIRMFNAFKAKLENAEGNSKPRDRRASTTESPTQQQPLSGADEEDEEAIVCDLHFIANCQSCRAWDEPAESGAGGGTTEQTGEEEDWMSHRLSFARDNLGKDLNWKRQNQDADSLMVIDPRQKEKEIVGGRKREKERKRKMEGGGNREWDQRGR
jgi:peptidyl-prolyl cis-trans isomerase SDCCAG10